jgi:hypothetical protein
MMFKKLDFLFNKFVNIIALFNIVRQNDKWDLKLSKFFEDWVFTFKLKNSSYFVWEYVLIKLSTKWIHINILCKISIKLKLIKCQYKYQYIYTILDKSNCNFEKVKNLLNGSATILPRTILPQYNIWFLSVLCKLFKYLTVIYNNLDIN